MSLQLTKFLHFNSRVLDVCRLHYTLDAVRILASRFLPDARCNRFVSWTGFYWIDQKSGLARRTVGVPNTARVNVFFALQNMFLFLLNSLQNLMSEAQSALRSAVVNRTNSLCWFEGLIVDKSLLET